MNEQELDELRRIFSQPPFTRGNAVNNWLANFLRDLFAGVSPEAVRIGATVASAAILIAAALLLIRNWRANLISEASSINAPDDSLPQTSAGAIDNAQRHAGAGDYRQAMRQLYLATLLLLDERGALKFDRALTNRETVRALKQSPELAAALSTVVDVYDRVWYGFAPVTPEQFERYRAAIESVRQVRA